MLEDLPIELIGHILHILAEMSLVSDPSMVFRIALLGSAGYTAAIPVLYRTLRVDGSTIDVIARIFDDSERSTAVSGSRDMLQLPPTIRLCPHVRRIFIRGSNQFPYLRLLPNLEMVFTLSNNRRIIPQEDFPHLSKSLTRYTSLSSVRPDALPPTITHASFYLPMRTASGFRDYAAVILAETITHIAIELNDQVFEGAALHLRRVLTFLLCRTTTVVVVLRLYRAAVLLESVEVVTRVIRGLVPADLQRRMLIWKDQRQIESSRIDISTSLQDAMEGRTPWTEGQAVESSELENADRADKGGTLYF